jgi:hypothetical protein
MGIMDHVVFEYLIQVNLIALHQEPRGNNFILIVLDLFSRFIILRAIPDKSATTVAKEWTFIVLLDMIEMLNSIINYLKRYIAR